MPLAEYDAEVGRVPGEEHLYRAMASVVWMRGRGEGERGGGRMHTFMLHMFSMPPPPP